MFQTLLPIRGSLLSSQDCIQYCDQEIFPLGAERRYQPNKLSYLLSLFNLIGASSEISGAERTLLLLSQFSVNFRNLFLKTLSSLDSADCLEFNDIFFVSETFLMKKKFISHHENSISYFNTCKSTKFYLSSLIFRKQLIIFEIKIHPWIR